MRVVQKKVCMLGDFAVGKTSLVRRYVEGRFDDKYLSTVGVKISRKVLERADHRLNLILWDLAGGENFRDVSASYVRGAAGALLVCDLTRPGTVGAIEEYAGQLRQMNPETKLVVAGNKVDLSEERAVDDDALAAAAEAITAAWFLTSAKTGDHVEDLFTSLADQLEPPGE